MAAGRVVDALVGGARVGNIDESRFADVDADEWWAPYVERMAELGVTGGCSRGPLRYCPDSTASRGELAAFVSRALDLPVAEPAGFSDTDGHTHEDAIDRLAAARFSPHCGGRLLKDCDSDLVARAREAGFLCRDEPLKYCPDSPVTKAQLAVFIFRALDWWRLNTVAESSRVPDGIFLTDYNEFSWYVKTQIVDRDGDDHPWLKAAWNMTNRATSIYLADNYQSGLSVDYGIAKPHGEYPHIIAKVISAAPERINRRNQPNIVHELAHVYTLSNRVVNDPLPIAVAHLYFEDLSRGGLVIARMSSWLIQPPISYSKSDSHPTTGGCVLTRLAALPRKPSVLSVMLFRGQCPNGFTTPSKIRKATSTTKRFGRPFEQLAIRNQGWL